MYSNPHTIKRDMNLENPGENGAPTEVAKIGGAMDSCTDFYGSGGWEGHFWLVVSTPLKKYATVKLGSSSPKFGVKITKYLSCHHLDFLEAMNIQHSQWEKTRMAIEVPRIATRGWN